MKHFNNTIYNLNLKDMRSLDKDVHKNTYYSWVLDIADSFVTDQVSVGCLSRNDIIQEAYLAFEVAWSNLDWNAIQGAKEEQHPAIIWAYLKKSVKLKVRNAITYVKDGIRTHSIDGVKLGNSVDDFLSILFNDFHEDCGTVWEEPVSMWDIERLAIGLDKVMEELLAPVEKRTLEMYYGIDCEKVSLKVLADMFNTNQNAITVRKLRSLRKMDNSEAIGIIRNNF